MLLDGFRRKISSVIRRAFALVPALATSSCALHTGVLDPQGPIAAAERLLLINSTAIMLGGVIPKSTF
jgi:heme/copper-type cytochrome/quinol oxidase subunit 2